MKQNEVFDSELDAAIYPLPLFTYKVIKILFEINSPILPAILSNSISVLLGFALCKIYKDPKSSDMQVKYFTLVARLLNLMRSDLSQ